MIIISRSFSNQLINTPKMILNLAILFTCEKIFNFVRVIKNQVKIKPKFLFRLYDILICAEVYFFLISVILIHYSMY